MILRNLIRVAIKHQFPDKPHFFTFGSEGDVRVKNIGVEEMKPARRARLGLECESRN
ncbi:MAG: hypothetical protein M3512_12685 [Bacteroidota bacterium]|nr:hypothetical protein [Bacteroidota bacterium]